MTSQARISVLASGGGSNLQALIDHFAGPAASAGVITFVASERAEAGALDRARAAGIATGVIDAPLDSDAILKALWRFQSAQYHAEQRDAKGHGWQPEPGPMNAAAGCPCRCSKREPDVPCDGVGINGVGGRKRGASRDESTGESLSHRATLRATPQL